MYLVAWVENGVKKTFVCEGYIEREGIIDELTEKGLNPIWKTL